MSAAVLERTPGGYRVRGPMTFSTVTALYDQTLSPAGDGPVQIDLTSVEDVDSAGMALMVDWVAQCRTDGLECRFQGAGDRIQKLLAVLNLSAIVIVSEEDIETHGAC